MKEQELEQEIKEKGLTGQRVTSADIDAAIVGEEYYVFPQTTLTVCCLYLRNGFTVTGEAACADVKNFDREIGRKLARDDARNKIWKLEGYLLRHMLYLQDKARRSHFKA